MYEAYWRLDCKPFENTPDPKFLYYSPKHEEALMRLLYAAREHKQGAILTGEYGSGKTVLSRVLLKDLTGDQRFQTVLVVNPKITKKELVKEILFQMGMQEIPSEELELLHLLEKRLKENLEQHKRTVFILDEAQTLTVQELEELRLLFNFQSQDAFLVTLILIGQNDLREKIQKIEPLKQRLALRFHLAPLDLEEVEAFITHRLGIAGKREPIFSKGALGLIDEGTRGIPRQINNICDYALLIGMSRKVAQIGVEIVEDCLKDMDLAPTKKMESSDEEKTRQNSSDGEDQDHGTHRRYPEEGQAELIQGEGTRRGAKFSTRTNKAT